MLNPLGAGDGGSEEGGARRRTHTRAWLIAAGFALAGHAVVLGGWLWSLPTPSGHRRLELASNGVPRVWQFRHLADTARATTESPGAWPADPKAHTRVSTQVPAAGAHRSAQPAPTPGPRAGPVAKVPGSPAAQTAKAMPTEAPTTPSSPAEPLAPIASSAPVPVPTYRTALPPSLVLDYDVQHGSNRGHARLEWRVQPDSASADAIGPARSYALSLRGLPDSGNDALAPAGHTPVTARARAALLAHWTSHGTLDADGIAPERFAVARRGRERHAANFRRDIGQISFSGPAHTWPLAAGAQDRLSWIVQLAAILQADPALAGARAARISMMVAGAHGDVGVWTFVAQGTESLPGPGGEAVEAFVFKRLGEHPHDADVEVAVAREVHHLPLRLRLTRRQGAESTEWRLRTLQAP